MKTSLAILKELSKNLFLSLYYLDLYFVINPDDLETTFDICKQIKLKKLLIRNCNRNNLDNLDVTLNVIKDFIKENNNLEFLAYDIGSIELLGISDTCYKSYKSLEENQSFVKMVKYKDLAVKVSDIDGNLVMN